MTSSAAVVIDIGTDEIRIGLAGDADCTTGPALAAGGDTWAEATSTALRALASTAGIALAGRHVLLTESIDQRNGPRQARERWIALLFEHLSASTVYVAERSGLALYTTRQTSGIVVDAAHAVPIYEGYALPHAVKRLDGESSGSIVAAVAAAAQALDADLKEPLLNIVLCGRAEAESEALVAAVQTEVAALTAPWNVSFPGHPATPVRVVVAPHGKAAAWHGGGLLAGLDPGTGMWIRRAEYDAEGAAIVHRKCC